MLGLEPGSLPKGRSSKHQMDGPVFEGVGDDHRDGVGFGVVLPVAGGPLTDAELLGFGWDADDGYARGVPPGLVGACFGCGAYGDHG